MGVDIVGVGDGGDTVVCGGKRRGYLMVSICAWVVILMRWVYSKPARECWFYVGLVGLDVGWFVGMMMWMCLKMYFMDI